MMKCLEDYKKYVLIGGGTVAKRMQPQLKKSGLINIGVADNLDDSRKMKSFNGTDIHNLSRYVADIMQDDTCAILAINAFFSFDMIEYYKSLGLNIDKLYVPNPYTSLRPCVMNDDFAAEKRIPITDARYLKVRNFFDDNESLKIFDKLHTSKTYDNQYDSYELVPYSEIVDMYYFEETYWKNYSFKKSVYNRATVVDCGAYVGDDVEDICRAIPEKSIHYYAIEPDKENAEFIRNNEKFKNLCNSIDVLEYGVGSKNSTLGFIFDTNQKDGGRCIEVDESFAGEKISVKKIDDMELSITGQLYIKMDVEGAELDALKGAEECIKKYRPYLAICVYHRKNDLIDIPLFINSLNCKYKYYLRGGFHTILWAIPVND